MPPKGIPKRINYKSRNNYQIYTLKRQEKLICVLFSMDKTIEKTHKSTFQVQAFFMDKRKEKNKSTFQQQNVFMNKTKEEGKTNQLFKNRKWYFQMDVVTKGAPRRKYIILMYIVFHYISKISLSKCDLCSICIFQTKIWQEIISQSLCLFLKRKKSNIFKTNVSESQLSFTYLLFM